MKKKIILIIIGLYIFLPFNAKAFQASVSFNCDKAKLGPNESMQCTINVPVTEDKLGGFEAYYSVTGGMSVTNYVKTGAWQGDGDEGHIVLYHDSGFNGTVGVGKFTVTAPANFSGTGSVNLTGIVLTGIIGNDQTKIRPSNISKTVTAKSTNSSLRSLSVNTGTLSPAFSPATTNYNVTTEASSITISGPKDKAISRCFIYSSSLSP